MNLRYLIECCEGDDRTDIAPMSNALYLLEWVDLWCDTGERSEYLIHLCSQVKFPFCAQRVIAHVSSIESVANSCLNSSRIACWTRGRYHCWLLESPLLPASEQRSPHVRANRHWTWSGISLDCEMKSAEPWGIGRPNELIKFKDKTRCLRFLPSVSIELAKLKDIWQSTSVPAV